MLAESLLQVAELLPGPALVVGSGGEILGANDRAVHWIGAGRAGIVGRPLAGLFADDPGQVIALLDECTRGVHKAAGAFTPARGGGTGGECRVEGISVPSREGGGPNLVVIHVLLDRHAGGAAPGAGQPDVMAALREEVRGKDELIDRLAHDLRNPVAAISSALHLARRATAPEDVAWAEAAVDRQLKNLVQQLDDLLDLSRITRGKVELKRQRLDAATAARAAAAAARATIEGRDHQLTVSTSAGDLDVEADPERLERILVGLLGHVAGATEPGGRIRLSVARERDAIVFRIRNRGDEPARGASPQDVGSPATESRPEDEPGLRLMLIRRLAEMHGGSVSVRSPAPGEGREFAVRLPAFADLPGPVDGVPNAGPAGERILVVDDNVDTARGTARLLQMSGHDVRVAHDGREALEVARGHDPRFILLDIGLPGMDGYEVARQLRGDPRHRDATIIAISGYSEDDYRPAEQLGFDHHLVKPIDYGALRAIIEGCIGGAP
jgi:CheY-like chemotaxis protein/nitrogen-specific signal transduction histidine kinase